MLKLPIFRRLIIVSIFITLGAVSLLGFAGIQYQNLRLAYIERDNLYYLSNLKYREQILSYSLLKIFDGHLKKALSRDTSIDPSIWIESNPTSGQCAIAALIVQHFFGGEIVEADIPPEWQELTVFSSHLWNRVEGQNLDFTRDQFPPSFPYYDLIDGRMGEVRKIGREVLLADQYTVQSYQRVINKLKITMFN